MVIVHSLTVTNTRSHEEYGILFSKDTTVITGTNGTGKTTLLEAIYVALRGTSFKGTDTDILRHDSPWWKIEITLENERRIITYDPSRPFSKKQFIIDNKKTARLSKKDKYPIVLFEPEDLRVLTGSPQRRRQFIDSLINHVDPFYTHHLRTYEKALRQRNNLLKSPYCSPEQLFSWDILIAEHGAAIITARTAYIERLNIELTKTYQYIANSHDECEITYSYTGANTKERLLRELHTNTQHDIRTGSTSVGPHRHDIHVFLNGRPISSVGSRGENRTALLALKFIEVDIVEETTGKKPIILLDDVFSELDEMRQEKLKTKLHNYQILITSTHNYKNTEEQHITLL